MTWVARCREARRDLERTQFRHFQERSGESIQMRNLRLDAPVTFLSSDFCP
jgi:hypothetical protein